MRGLALKMTCLVLFCFITGFAYGQGTIELPRTNETTCYDENGNVISCTNTGQDGDIKAGESWPAPRFHDNGNGTITDNLTGLIWLKNANCYTPLDWATSLQACNELGNGMCGLTDGSVAGDWRLPNIVELESLFSNSGVSDSAAWLMGQGFTNVISDYWSSTTFIGDKGCAWLVNANGGVYYYDKRANVSKGHWPVRGGSN